MKRSNLILVAGLVAIVIIIAIHNMPYDSTDDPKGIRSGLSLYTDHLTGCQYIKGGLFGTMLPRMYLENGYLLTHMCGPAEEWLLNQAKE